MFQIRIHGRGGQGVVTAAELLSVAAFEEGAYAQAFPSFGSERTGAPVIAVCRNDDKEIRLREPIVEPDALIVQDPTLFKVVDVFQGLRPRGYVLINSNKSLAELQLGGQLAHVPPEHVRVVNATGLALQYIKRPLPNAVLLGAFAALSGIVQLASVANAIRQAFPGPIGDANVAAATAAYEAAAPVQRERQAAC